MSSKIYEQNIHIPELNRNRTIRILLPKTYNKFPNKKFRVIYMMDGQNLFSAKTSYGPPWNLQKYMDVLPLKYQSIIVGIDHGGAHRKSEYLPPSSHHQATKGQGDLFLNFIINRLKPKVDEVLRTLPDRDNTIIVGSSMGGLMAYYATTRRNDIFGKAGVLSPSFWMNKGIMSFPSGNYGKIYVSGSKTESQSMHQTLQLTYYELKKAGYSDANLRVIAKDRGKHNEILWRGQFVSMIKWFCD
ncbi:MAG: alpha/beta hydrolase-fold protein [Saprospiraceae bacterium]